MPTLQSAVSLVSKVHLPQRTVRLRLTLLYGTLFLVAGAALLAITYWLVVQRTGDSLYTTSLDGAGVGIVAVPVGATGAPVFDVLAGVGTPEQVVAQADQLRALAAQQHDATMDQLLINSGIALALMAVISIGLGWLTAGRVLRPLRKITSTARRISATNLHERLALTGPDDEITELSATFDDLLDRLERSFDAQRQFVANASHELRTPLARQRTLIEVALDDPTATVDSLRATYERVLAAGEQQERLIEALLTLARSERGLDREDPVDLADAARAALAAFGPATEREGLRVTSTLDAAPTMGDARLIERLVTNLLDNAARYNVDGGHIEISTGVDDARAVLRVSNSGPMVPDDNVAQLFLPFRRLAVERTTDGGLGLGLSIVKAIAEAHEAAMDAKARPQGGMTIEFSFAARPGHAQAAIAQNLAGIA